MSMRAKYRAISAGMVVVAGAAALALGAGTGAAAPGTGSVGAGSADLSVALSSGFDNCYLTVTNNGPDTAQNVIAGPSSPVALLAGGPPRYLGTLAAGQARTVAFVGCDFIQGPPLSYFVVSTTGDPRPANNTVTY